ncbi:uncharacterized protein PGTG_07986 [Puccinia graminis f. sp. tritici CRL 75-36-700-3]|uniref:Uracil-DNA glycosylase-like domain-containing protein n=1 Tax=Puccinia graminis f. sp. tritici (strain CRL 75-36-700-3 / race SCCL) TaxID=418459 RepID=E3KBU2_PUCGT|nr:uncharacterized protein PGTG_07986 [Puccinia graminis f. sp. tritici CRL 75-36-700-3]EFP81737.2 hypothetical protein PGTG_07986 [Puccinia graminis f. sp. tritici CRL 75-36-700-3]
MKGQNPEPRGLYKPLAYPTASYSSCLHWKISIVRPTKSEYTYDLRDRTSEALAGPVDMSPGTLQSKYFASKASAKSKDDGSSGCHFSGNRTERVVTRALAKVGIPFKRNRSLSASSFSASIACEKDTCDDHEKVMISKHFKPGLPAHTPRKQKKARQYAAPAVYQHLNHLPDLIAPSLDVSVSLLLGNYRKPPSPRKTRNVQTNESLTHSDQLNKSWMSIGQNFALLCTSIQPFLEIFISECMSLLSKTHRFTPHRLSPHDDHLLPSEFGLGLTDLVCRPTAEANELSGSERLQGVPVLLGKIRRFQPRFLCFVGIKQYHDLCSYLKKKLRKSRDLLPSIWQSPSQKTVVGLQNVVFRSQKTSRINKGQSKSTAADADQYSHTFVFVCPSTSALVRNYPEKDRVACFRKLLELKNRASLNPDSSATPIASGSSRTKLCLEYIEIDDALLS